MTEQYLKNVFHRGICLKSHTCFMNLFISFYDTYYHKVLATFDCFSGSIIFVVGKSPMDLMEPIFV